MGTNISCHICNEELKEITTEIETKWGEYEIIIKGVKAYKCPNCESKIYSSDEVDMIQNLAESFSEVKKEKQPDVLNVKEVSDLLRVSKQTVYNMIKDGRLEPFKAGREWRFMRQDITSIIEDKDNDFFLAARGDISDEDKSKIQEELNSK